MTRSLPTVLIVDDKLDICWALIRVLNALGVPSVTASSSREALRVAQERPVRLVFVDAELPDGEGLELVRRIRGTSPGVGAFLISGHRDRRGAKVAEALASGIIDGLVSKPFERDEIEALIGSTPPTSLRQDRLGIADLRKTLATHPLYERIVDERAVRLLMRSHVFAVWDFQSLLKAMQRALTCVEVPWLPTPDAAARRFINEIVLDEESDAVPGGGYLSHFELYLWAMKECGADAGPIEAFLRRLRHGRPVDQALSDATLPRGVPRFVRTTMEVARSGQVHRIAAAFAFGREEVIPVMFRRLVDGLARAAPGRWATFRHYLTRHIEHDEDTHGPLARQLVERLCGTDERLWSEAAATAREALEARTALWDGVVEALDIRS